MTVKVLAFGIVRDIFGGSSIDVPLEPAATSATLKANLELWFPKLAKLSSYMVAVNNEYAHEPVELHPNDEIAIIPPVSGG